MVQIHLLMTSILNLNTFISCVTLWVIFSQSELRTSYQVVNYRQAFFNVNILLESLVADCSYKSVDFY